METAGNIIWSRKCEIVFTDSPPFPSYEFYVGVASIVVNVDF